MKKCLTVIVMITVLASLFAPVSVVAIDSNTKKGGLGQNAGTATSNTQTTVENYDQPQDCNSLLGNPEDENSVAWLIQKILNYIQIIGPLLVVVLSSIDFAKVIIQSDDEAMAKATKKLTTRLILAASLFFLPTLVSVLLQTFGLTSDPTCGLN